MQQHTIECGSVVEIPIRKGNRKGFGRAVVTAVHERDVIETRPILVNMYPVRMFPALFRRQDVEVLDTRSLLLHIRSVVLTSKRWSLEKVEEGLDQCSILRYGQPLSKSAKESLAEEFRK